MQEKAAENDSWLAAKTLATLVFRVDSGKNGPGDILQSDISHLQLNTLLCTREVNSSEFNGANSETLLSRF